MCKRLSERAADDLLAFVRKVRRAGVGSGATARALEMLAEDGGALLAKHGLLTPADDPEVAGVFMETAPFTEGEKRCSRECINSKCEGADPDCPLIPSRYRYANKESGQ